VWVPLAADPWISEHSPARGVSPLRQLPNKCGECGAPWQPDDQGACPYCHAQLTAPVLATLEPTHPASTAQPFLNTVIGLFDRSRF
jgi:hypothetical protein